MISFRVSYWDKSSRSIQHMFFSAKTAKDAVNAANVSIDEAHHNKTVAVPISALSTKKSTATKLSTS